MTVSHTAQTIVDAAEYFVQSRGYNGFSFRDVAAAVGIRSASVHHHFATKEHLAVAVSRRYAKRFAEQLDALAATGRNGRWKLVGYAALHRHALMEDGRMCLFGMLASEMETLPVGVRGEVARFFQQQQAWLTEVIAEGIKDGSIGPDVDSEGAALMMLAAVEGGLLLSRSRDDPRWFDLPVRTAIMRLTAAG